MRTPLLLILLLAAPLLPAAPTSALTPAVAVPSAATAGAQRLVAYRSFEGRAAFVAGGRTGLVVRDGRLVLDTSPAAPQTHRRFDGRSYDVGRWTSPWTSPGFGLSELVASWSARTPGDSWVEVRVRGRAATGRLSSWDVLGRWARSDGHVRRTSVPGSNPRQSDDLATVAVDTWRATRAAGLTSYQLEVSLLRATGARTASPALLAVGAVASRLPSDVPPVSAPGVARGVVLDVPRYSQMVHRGSFEQYGGGGEAWCSPTSLSMVLSYYRALPPRASYPWVPAGTPDPWVPAVARGTYDASYEGTGNWPFNTAYAAGRTGHAFVTRLRSLREAERYVRAGIPLVASISFGRGGLDGAPISATGGHLVVIAGFTPDGDVVVNDPAASTDATVRRTYDRAQLEAAWLGGSGGLVYVIRDGAHPLPR